MRSVFRKSREAADQNKPSAYASDLSAARDGRGNVVAIERFVSSPSLLIFGKPGDSLASIAAHMKFDDHALRKSIGCDGVAAIIREIKENGTEEDNECLQYVLHSEAGSSPRTFQNGLKRDCDANGEVYRSRLVPDEQLALIDSFSLPPRASQPKLMRGMKIDDFVAHRRAQKLRKDHVVALRLYTTNVRGLPHVWWRWWSAADAVAINNVPL